MASILPVPKVQDLKLTFQEPTLVFPLQKTQRRSVFLSNIDQLYNTDVRLASFFRANPDFPPEIVAKRIKMALEKVLVPYDFAAGRLKIGQESGRLEIDCNSAGAGFVVASSEFSLRDLGDLNYSNPGFRQLSMYDEFCPRDDPPLIVLQVTSFKCGGFTIGLALNHILFDGPAFQKFMDNLATQSFDDGRPLDVIPCNDRHLLDARSPPLVSFEHPEFHIPSDRLDSVVKPELDSRVFNMTSDAINYLKYRANASPPSATTTRIATTYTVVAALIWRCKALSSDCADKERVLTLLTSADIRPRLDPPLPPSYCGNGLLYAKASLSCEDIEKWPFAELVRVVSEGIGRFTNEYARSVIDLLEINKGKLVPRVEYNVSSWLRLGADQIMYPWGKPICVGPVVSAVWVCFLFPSVDGGVSALVTLPPNEMQRFQDCFFHFFSGAGHESPVAPNKL